MREKWEQTHEKNNIYTLREKNILTAPFATAQLPKCAAVFSIIWNGNDEFTSNRAHIDRKSVEISQERKNHRCASYISQVFDGSGVSVKCDEMRNATSLVSKHVRTIIWCNRRGQKKNMNEINTILHSSKMYMIIVKTL